MRPIDLPISTDRLTIRMMRAADADAFATYRDHPEVARYQDWELPYTYEMARRLIDGQADLAGPTPGDWVQLAITLRDNPDAGVIGDLAVGIDADATEAMIGYTVATDHQGRGVAREAVEALLGALESAGILRCVASVDPRNEPSRRLLRDVGFVLEHTGRIEVRGQWCDDETWVRPVPRR